MRGQKYYIQFSVQDSWQNTGQSPYNVLFLSFFWHLTKYVFGFIIPQTIIISGQYCLCTTPTQSVEGFVVGCDDRTCDARVGTWCFALLNQLIDLLTTIYKDKTIQIIRFMNWARKKQKWLNISDNI